MYLSYYHLIAKPFEISADPKFLWLGQKHLKALATLKYAIASKEGLLCLTGDVGTGKTILVNALLNRLDQSVVSAIVPDPTLENSDFFEFFAGALGINKPFASKGAFLWTFSEYLQQMYHERKKVLLIIDEAQRLTDELLDEIRLLTNIEENETRLLKIFFIGQNDFEEVLAKPCNKSLQQRIALSYHISPLDEDETAKYIQHRISVAGGTDNVFTAGALKKVFQYSNGYPRLINIICDLALLNGYEQERPRITTAVVNACGEELQLSRESRKQGQETVPRQKPVGPEREPVPVAPTKSAHAIHAHQEKASNSRLQYVLTLCIALLLCGSVGLTHLYRKERAKATSSAMQVQQLSPRPSPQSQKDVVSAPPKALAPEAAMVPFKATSSERSNISQPAQTVMTQELARPFLTEGEEAKLPGVIKPLKVSEPQRSPKPAAKTKTSAASAPAKTHPSPADKISIVVDPPPPKDTFPEQGKSQLEAPTKRTAAPGPSQHDQSKAAMSSPSGIITPTRTSEPQPSQDRLVETKASSAETLDKESPTTADEPVTAADLSAKPAKPPKAMIPLSNELEKNIYQLDQADRQRSSQDSAQDTRPATEQRAPEPTDVIDWLMQKRSR